MPKDISLACRLSRIAESLSEAALVVVTNSLNNFASIIYEVITV